MQHVRSRPVPAGERYDGFIAPLAAEVHRLDGCFGAFIDDLKRRGRYDNSIIVLTADHGDSLGEDGRWGHSYTLVPEVVSIPLIVHLPSAIVGERAADLDAVALSTDITPTLYAALGYTPRAADGLVGRPLVSRSRRLGSAAATRRCWRPAMARSTRPCGGTGPGSILPTRSTTPNRSTRAGRAAPGGPGRSPTTSA